MRWVRKVSQRTDRRSPARVAGKGEKVRQELTVKGGDAGD